MAEQWQYSVDLFIPDAEEHRELSRQWFPNKSPSDLRRNPSFLGPTLDVYGKAGWELIQLTPMVGGYKGAVAVASRVPFESDTRGTFEGIIYMAVWKRRIGV